MPPPASDIREMLRQPPRAIVFTRVNTDQYLDPEDDFTPDNQKELTPSLLNLFRDESRSVLEDLGRVRNELTVSSFEEFLVKFRPGLYYGIAPADSVAKGYPAGPQILFSLEKKERYRKITLTPDHPYIESIRRLVAQRGRVNTPSGRVDIVPSDSEEQAAPSSKSADYSECRVDLDAPLWLSSPYDLTDLYRSAVELERADRELREATAEAQLHQITPYNNASTAFIEEIGEVLSLLPTTVFHSGPVQQSGDEDGEKLFKTPIHRNDGTGRSPLTDFIMRTMSGVHTVGLVGKRVAAASSPRSVTSSYVDPPIDSSAFDRIYGRSVEEFLRMITPLMEQILGIYLLFNEFPSEEQLKRAFPEERSSFGNIRPQVIIANAHLSEFKPYQEPLARFFEKCHQATNKYEDALSFAIVPCVAPFSKTQPKSGPSSPQPSVDEAFFASIPNKPVRETQDSATTFFPELSILLKFGADYGFQTLFSPKDKVVPGQADREDFERIRADYTVDHIVDNRIGEAAVLCIPDFVLIPRDGGLVIATNPEEASEVKVPVLELIVRSCFVAAGRLMANDIAICLKYKQWMHGRSESDNVDLRIPGIAVDLEQNPYMGSPAVPRSFALEPGICDLLEQPEMPFAVFADPFDVTTHEKPVSVFRTMRRHGTSDKQTFAQLHGFRSSEYHTRLVNLVKLDSTDEAQAKQDVKDVFDKMMPEPEKYMNPFPGWNSANDH